MVTKAVEAFGPSFNVYFSPQPYGAGVAMIDGQNHHPWRLSFMGEAFQTVQPEGLLDWWIYIRMHQPPHL